LEAIREVAKTGKENKGEKGIMYEESR